jgi:hypothetical protein
VTGKFSCGSSPLISLKGVPYYIGGNFSCTGTNITSLAGVDKIIKHVGGIFFCPEHAIHLLGLLLIQGITEFNIDAGGPIDNIMDKYVGTGDILSAQDELIDAGLTDQARL